MIANLDSAAAVLRNARSVVTMGHIGPDGDALGSMLALAAAARGAGKEAYATFGEPFVVGKQFGFLDTTDLVAPGQIPEDVDVVVVVDTGVPDRLGSALPVAQRATTLIIVDHHLSQDDAFGDIKVVDTTAGAAAQIVFQLIKNTGWEVTAEIATALYTGVVTDTGRFQYEATSPAVHRIAAELLESGVSPPVVGQKIYEEAPFGYLHVAGAVLGRAELDLEHKVVWSVLYQADLSKEGLRYEEADGLIDLVRLAEESEVACLLRELGDGQYKGSLRSRGRVDVSRLAGRFGGGGHHNAAGFVAEGTPESIIAAVVEAIG
jgi:phosphoesterase RecJ-like protein